VICARTKVLLCGSEVYTNQRACIIELEVNPEVREISGRLDSFNLARRVAVCSR
jgi:hypothetical protein